MAYNPKTIIKDSGGTELDITAANAAKVDGSAVTQPVSGTVTSDAGTNLNTSALALEAGGNLASIKAKTDNIPAQGQALAAASLPVVLTAAQITTLTPIAGALEATMQSVKTAVELLDNAISGAGFNVTQLGGTNVAMGTGARSSGTQRVTVATDDLVPVGGDVAHDAADSGNPLKIGVKAVTTLPMVANGDRVNVIGDICGRPLVAHIDPAMQIWKVYNDTSSRGAGSAQVIWTPTSGKKIFITHFVISTYGTTSARMFLFLAANADLTYTSGTDQPVFVGSFSPSATVKPGVVVTLPVPIMGATADHKLLYQNDAALSVDIVVYGYEM